ncbi:MAG: RNA polymerase sigma-54 factor [Firmicutes bacterium HGW-Firmicutes-7]|nr:MAG: RNA polymerase sigma-54 factor [Firmicutes bacterium HGW-Firmicutes-7]
MELEMNLNLSQDQKLLMTPQLEYSLRILKINNEELIELIEEEIHTNPLLEYCENISAPSEEVKRIEDKITNYNLYETSYYKSNESDELEYINSIPDLSSIKPNLVQHLMLQLHTAKVTRRMMELCEYIIESIDSNGYLEIDEKGIQNISCTSEEVNQAIDLVQSLDPPGIGARNLRECLRLQIVRNNIIDSNLMRMVDNHLEDVGANRIPYLSQELGLGISQINELITIIKSFDPKPGSAFSIDDTRYIKPDVIVCKNNDQFEAKVNKEQLPVLGVNEYYSGLLAKRNKLSLEEYSYINKNYSSANWLIRCIEQRLHTLERVSTAILLEQIDFFKYGRKYLKPLTLKDIAYSLEIHESTVSRAVNEKYLMCQWGVFELKHFFSSKTIRKIGADDTSSSDAKLIMREIIEEEDKTQPLSDTAICERLKEKDIFISRRTVAKYRAQLNIPTRDLRKSYF